MTPEEQALIDKGVQIGLERGKEKYAKELADLEKLKKDLHERDDLIKQLNDQKGMTETEKESLVKKIEELQAGTLSVEDKLKRQMQKEVDARDKALKAVTEEKDLWAKNFRTKTIENAIMAAASKHGAFSPSQIVPLILGNTSIEDIMDENKKPTGNFKIAIKLKIPGQNGKDFEEKEFDVEEGVKNFLALSENSNLSKVNVAKTPNMRNTQTGKVSIKDMSLEDIQKNMGTLLAAQSRGEIVR